MKVRDMRLVYDVDPLRITVRVKTATEEAVLFMIWFNIDNGITKPQAIAIAKRLCDRFNAGQKEKP